MLILTKQYHQSEVRGGAAYMLAGVNFTQIQLKDPIAHFLKPIQRASTTTQLGLFSSMCLEVMTVAVTT